VILVTVGTHEYPFDRLVRAAEDLATTVDEEVVIQRGTSRVPVLHATAHELLEPAQLEAEIERARVVVCHAGPATILLARSLGRIPVVVPRDPSHREHVDAHQLAFARRIADRIHLVEDPAGLATAVARHPEIERDLVQALDRPPGDGDAVGRLAAVVDSVVEQRRVPRLALRATMAFFERTRPRRR